MMDFHNISLINCILIYLLHYMVLSFHYYQNILFYSNFYIDYIHILILLLLLLYSPIYISFYSIISLFLLFYLSFLYLYIFIFRREGPANPSNLGTPKGCSAIAPQFSNAVLFSK